jgi:hypothetical protein
MKRLRQLLSEIRQRPSMYVGGDDKIRQLEDLELLITGYQLALYCLETEDSDAMFLESFGKYVRATRGWSMSCGPDGGNHRKHRVRQRGVGHILGSARRLLSQLGGGARLIDDVALPS